MEAGARDALWRFAEFDDQESALRRAADFGGAPAWAVDLRGGGGAKRYVVAGYECFWFWYSGLPRAERHAYELIREGEPCKLYQDVDRPLAKGEAFDGKAAIAEIARETAAALGREGFGPEVAVVDLESSGSRKFSRHLVYETFDADGAQTMFADNRACGAFAQAQKLPDVDLGVYTKNRVFRLAGSRKLGSRRVLRFRGLPRTASAKGAFFRSLVQRPREGARVKIVEFRCPGDDARPRGGWAGSAASAAVPPEAESIAADIARAWDDGGVYPHSYDPERQEVRFRSDSRKCEQLGDAHKNNHVHFTASLARKTWWQGCFGREPPCVDEDGKPRWSAGRPFSAETLEVLEDRDAAERENRDLLRDYLEATAQF